MFKNHTFLCLSVLRCMFVCLRVIIVFIPQWATSWWHSESPSRSWDPGIFFPFQEETHQQRAGGPTREDSHWKRSRDWVRHEHMKSTGGSGLISSSWGGKLFSVFSPAWPCRSRACHNWEGRKLWTSPPDSAENWLSCPALRVVQCDRDPVYTQADKNNKHWSTWDNAIP